MMMPTGHYDDGMEGTSTSRAEHRSAHTLPPEAGG